MTLDPVCLLCSVMDFYPAQIQLRWFQNQQELSEHVVATDMVANGDWTYQLLVLLETPPRRGLSYTCQVEHVSLEQPLRQRWGTGEALGGCQRHWDVSFVLGWAFLALGFGFNFPKKAMVGPRGLVASPGVCAPPHVPSSVSLTLLCPQSS
uniref:Ig-like domain-containing protein n=1 Tax=Ficedula albicollis TaxID=59894 RepID=U3JEU4_FICAL